MAVITLKAGDGREARAGCGVQRSGRRIVRTFLLRRGGSATATSLARRWRNLQAALVPILATTGANLPPVMVRMPDGEVRNVPALPLPGDFEEVIQSWDLAFKDLATSDFVVGQVWSVVKADRFLLDQKRDRMDMPATLAAIRVMSEKWPIARTALVEDKANGPAVISALQHDISGLIAVNPEGGKIARAQAVSPQCESGNVYLPHPALGLWVDNFIEECAGFPNAAHDDQVDAMTQALNRLHASFGVLGLTEYYKSCQQMLDKGLDPFAQPGKQIEGSGEPGTCPRCGVDSTRF